LKKKLDDVKFLNEKKGTARTALVSFLKTTSDIGLITVPLAFAKAGWVVCIIFV